MTRVRAIAPLVVAALTVAGPVVAEEKSPAPRKKTAATPAHKKASAEQIRRFNALAKKRQETK